MPFQEGMIFARGIIPPAGLFLLWQGDFFALYPSGFIIDILACLNTA
jgi:hypothetical protein